MAFKGKAGAFLQGFSRTSSPYAQAYFQHRLNAMEQRERMKQALAEQYDKAELSGDIMPTSSRITGTSPVNRLDLATGGNRSVPSVIRQYPSNRITDDVSSNPLSFLPGMNQAQVEAGVPNRPVMRQDAGQFTHPRTGRQFNLKTKREKWEPATEKELRDLEIFKTDEEIRKSKETAGLKMPMADASGLTAQQQVQARALSKKLNGVRGIEAGLPAIYLELKQGKTIDQIEDEWRFSGQSKEFVDDFRNAAQSILINTPEDRAQKSMDYIDDLYSKGNIEGAKTQLKRLARTQAGVIEAKEIAGQERTVKLLDEIQNDLNDIERLGINTNIFSGTAEEIAKKVGTVKDPEMRKVANKILAAIQKYRTDMSGKVFSIPESQEYKEMFPSISKTSQFNTANINSLKEVMLGNLDNFYSLAMGEEEYQKLFKNNTQNTGKKTSSAGNIQQRILNKQGKQAGTPDPLGLFK